MASRKHQRYGQGGFRHKHVLNSERPNGKAWKKRPKGWDSESRCLVLATPGTKGTVVN